MSEKIKPFDTNFDTNNSVSVQKRFSSLYSYFDLNLYIIYELNDWPRNPTNSFLLKNCLFGSVKIRKKRSQN